jgi:hypothetical protein
MSKTIRLDIEKFKQKDVKFPDRCVCCGAPADGAIPVHVEIEHYDWNLKIPYCHPHLNQVTHSRGLRVMAGILIMVFTGVLVAWLLIGLLTPIPIFAVKPGGELVWLVALMMGPFVAVGIGMAGA